MVSETVQASVAPPEPAAVPAPGPVAAAPGARAGWARAVYLDYRRYRAHGDAWYEVVFLRQGFWATCVYRTARASLGALDNWPLPRKVVRLFWAFGGKFTEVVTGVSMPPECDVGPGLYIDGPGYVILPSRGRIGSNCNLSRGVTIGVAGKGGERGAPTLGDRVHVGSNAVLVGRFAVGDDAAIGSCSLVTRAVPPRAVVAGNPGRVAAYDGSFELVRYDGMEADPDRLAAMRAPAPGNRPAAPRE